MKTLASSRSTVFSAFLILGSVTVLPAASAAPKLAQAAPAEAPTPAAPVPPPSGPPPAAPVEVVPVPVPVAPPAEPVAPAREATAVAGSPTPPPEPASEATPVTEIGLQRLPGSAYPEPQTRGLKYSSLWLTFHGLQWPYLPSTFGRNRFVVGVSGWGWVDTSYEKFAPWGPNPNLESSRVAYWKQQARMLLRLTPTYSFDDWFVQGQVELVGTEDQTISRSDVGAADTDDLWLRVGQWNKWDFQIGRFEGWEVFHLGMGLDQNTFERQGASGLGESAYAIGFYGLTDNQFRPQGAAGNLAFHYYPFRFLRFEMLGMAGTLPAEPAVAVRPVAILDFGWLKLKGGVEWQHMTGQSASDETDNTSKGVGGAVQFVFEPHIEFGLNAAQGTTTTVDNTGKRDLLHDLTRTSFGGFVNVSNGSPRHPLLFGLGGVFTRHVDQNAVVIPGVGDDYWLWQSFAAVQYVAFNQLYIKLVGGYSRGHWKTASSNPPLEFDDEVYSARLRFSFYF